MHGRSIHAPPHGRFRTAISPFTLESQTPRNDGSDDRTVVIGCPGEERMRRAKRSYPSTDSRTTAYSAKQQETLRRGLRILARMIARAHLRRQASRSGPAPEPPAEGEEAD